MVNTRPDLFFNINEAFFKNIKEMVGESGTSVLLVSVHPDSTLILCSVYGAALSFIAKVCNVLLPFGCYYLLMTLSRNCGKMLLDFVPVSLFRERSRLCCSICSGSPLLLSICFLNLVTTNSSEAMELLGNLTPAIVVVVILYIPALVLATISIVRKTNVIGSVYPQRT